jgi:hypothetical protein
MARIRTIQPTFAHSPSMKRISRDARLLFVLLWTVVDDEGRCHAAPDDLAKVLLPEDFDAPRYMHGWLDELENEGCIERYGADDIDYLRVRHWHKHQRVYHPTRSYLPPPPHECLSDSGIREHSGANRLRGRKCSQDQELGDRSDMFPENSREEIDDDTPVVVTRDTVLRDLRRVQKQAEADGAHPSALRSIALTAKIGLAPDKTRNSSGDEEMSPSPAVILGLPITGSIR